MKRRIKFAVSFFLTICFFLMAVYQFGQLTPYQKKLSYCYNSSDAEVPTEQAYRDVEKGNGLSVAWWKEKGVMQLTNPDLGTEANAPVLSVCGPTGLLFPEPDVFSGKALSYDQTNQCLLGSRTASLLFGGSEACGLKVLYDGKVFEVAGVLMGTKDAFLYEAGKEKELAFDRITVKCDEPADKAVLKNKVESLLGPDTLLDYDLLFFIAGILILVFPLLAAGCLLAMLSRFAKGERDNRIKALVWRVCFFGVLVITAKLTLDNLHIPVDFIPSKWSDFSFWSKLFEEKKQALVLFFTTGMTPADLLFFSPFLKTIFYGALGILSAVYGILCRRKVRING